MRPNLAKFYSQLGYIYRYAGFMDQSIQCYEHSQLLDSSYTNLVSTQGQITKSLIYQGEYEAAFASHEKMKKFLAGINQSANEKQLFYEGMIHL